MRSTATLEAMSVLTYLSIVLLGQAVFAAICGVSLSMLAAALRIWPSNLLRTQMKGASKVAKTSAIDHPDELAELLNEEYADLCR
ncbi:hypothetical protein A5753_05725 [Mycobacterium sp. 852002-51971_SCH5477799-a]|nr:hypothetical protein A5753_05725 [Mycobacterium sp. 852002-51971_SCH5477799-a]